MLATLPEGKSIQDNTSIEQSIWQSTVLIFFLSQMFTGRHMNLAASCYFNADFYAIKSPSFPKDRWRTYRDPGINFNLNKAQMKAPIKRA